MADITKGSGDFGVSRRTLLKMLSGIGLAAALGQELIIGKADAAVTGGLRKSSLTPQIGAFQSLETVFDGLRHSPLGTAQISISNSQLLVSNLGSSGQDGVSAGLGEVGGLHSTLQLPTAPLPVGASLEIEGRGQVNGVPNQRIATVLMEELADGRQLSVDFSSVGAPTYELLLFADGKQIFSRKGLQGIAGTTSPSVGIEYCCHTSIKCTWRYVAKTGFEPSGGGPTILTDLAVFQAENPTKQVAVASVINIRTRNIAQFTMTREWPILFGVPHRSLGAAQFEAAGGALTLSNIGSSGQDGVLFDFLYFIVGFVDIRGFRVDWLDLDPTGVLPVGATLLVGATGVVDGIPDQSLGQMQVENSASALQFIPDFSTVQSSTHQVEVYNQGVLVKAVRGHTGRAATVGSGASPKPWPTSVAILRGETSNYTFMWPNPLVITIPGEGAFTGDELRILAETGGVTSLRAVSLQAADISMITLIDETMTKGFDVYLPLIQKSL